VEVEWIRLEPDGPVVPADVRARLEEEEFADVASEVSAPDNYADPTGKVGLVPVGAFPSFDALLFGDAEAGVEPLAAGAISDPVFTQDGIYIIHKLTDPTEGEISDLMHFKLNRELFDQWQQDQLTRGSDEGWLKINFDSNRYAWVADQVRLTAPRTPPQPPPQDGAGGPGAGGF
jgi:hypothetical protein